MPGKPDWFAGWPLRLGTPLSFLLAIGVIILLVEKDGATANTLFSRDESERQSDLLLLTKSRSRLEGELCVPRNSSLPN